MNVQARLGKLEARLGAARLPARVVFISGGQEDDAGIPTFLASHGLREADGELIVFHTIYEARNGNAVRAPLTLGCVSLANRRSIA